MEDDSGTLAQNRENMKQVSDMSPRERMIQEQLVERGIRDPRVLEAMRSVPREEFLPTEIREQAYADGAAPIGHGQTISQPYIVAIMTERLDVRREHRVLEIGTGSGYQAAILARLGREVYTVERVKPLLDEAFERLMLLGIRNVHFRYGDGTLGWPEEGPFDRILIGAGAPKIPRGLLLEQLKDGGIAVLPAGPMDEQILVEVRREGTRLETTDICGCRFVKLMGEGGWGE
jgi:protein-L-isoaspartate(D-aspartate) O-methyltransferase